MSLEIRYAIEYIFSGDRSEEDRKDLLASLASGKTAQEISLIEKGAACYKTGNPKKCLDEVFAGTGHSSPEPSSPSPATSPQTAPLSSPSPKAESPRKSSLPSGVTPLDPDETRSGYCTEDGFVHSTSLASFNKPVLRHRWWGGYDDILMPYRDIKFKLNSDEPTDSNQFDAAIEQIVGDIVSVASGTFSRVCGLRRLKDFGGQLTVYVLGKADPIGTPERNKELSHLRAGRVAMAIATFLSARNQELKTKHGIAVAFFGAGEELSQSGPNSENPAERMTEIIIASQSPPRYWKQGAEFSPEWQMTPIVIPPSSEMQGIIPEDECIGQVDLEGCVAAVNQCIETVDQIAKVVYPYNPEVADDMARDLKRSTWGLEDLRVGRYWEAYHWLYRGFVGFPPLDETKGLSASLHQCFVEARTYLKNGGQFHSVRKGPLDVINPKATENVFDSHKESYCTEKGEFSEKEARVSEEPLGFVMRRRENKEELAVLGRDPVAVEYTTDNVLLVLPNSFVLPYYAWRIFEIADGRIVNGEEASRQVLEDLVNAEESNGFYGDCIPFFFTRTLGLSRLELYVSIDTYVDIRLIRTTVEEIKRQWKLKSDVEINVHYNSEPEYGVSPQNKPPYFAVQVYPVYESLFTQEANLGPAAFRNEAVEGDSRQPGSNAPVPVGTQKPE